MSDEEQEIISDQMNVIINQPRKNFQNILEFEYAI